MPGETIGDDLVRYAREHNERLNPTILHTLERLPDQEYRTMADVEKGVGGIE